MSYFIKVIWNNFIVSAKFAPKSSQFFIIPAGGRIKAQNCRILEKGRNIPFQCLGMAVVLIPVHAGD